VTCQCEATDRHFGAERAESDLAAYRRRGPTGTARRLLRLLRELGIQPDTLLDVGAGIGVLHHELLAGGAGTAVHVDAAGSYIRAAQAESGCRGHLDRVRFLHGDFLTLAPAIAPADLVTLDRVICCYPDLEPLLVASIGAARRYWAASFPRELWYVRLHTRWENRRRARAENPFRTFVHPVALIYDLLGRAGLRVLRVRRGPVWEIVVCERESQAEPSTGTFSGPERRYL
jgi:magnesium-protoporphyrin O-methyltransferase